MFRDQKIYKKVKSQFSFFPSESRKEIDGVKHVSNPAPSKDDNFKEEWEPLFCWQIITIKTLINRGHMRKQDMHLSAFHSSGIFEGHT